MKDPIERQAAIDAIDYLLRHNDDAKRKGHSQVFINGMEDGYFMVRNNIMQLPSVQSEPLTDKEQRIFLAAMGREEKVCEEVDRNYIREPYEDSLMRVCKEIRRKVKSALWI